MEARWKILLILFVARTGLGFQFQVLGSVTPQLVESLSIDYRSAGMLVGLFLLAGIFLSFPAGLANRYLSDRWLVTLGLLLLGSGGLLSGFASGYEVIALGRVISGAGFVFGTLYFAKMVADWFSGKELATAMGILVMSWPVGIALGQNLHPLIAEQFGYQTAFFMAAAYCILAALLMWLCYRPPADKAVIDSSQPNKQVRQKLSPIHLKLTLLAALVWAFFNAGYVVYLSFSAQALIQSGQTVTSAAIISSIPSWIMIFSAIVAGVLVDRTGQKNLVLYVSSLAAVISMLLLAFNAFVYFAVIIFGVIAMASAGVIMSLTGEAMPVESRAFGMGIFFTLYFLIGLPAPAIAGWLYDITGDAGMPLVFGALLFVMAALANVGFRFIQRGANQI